MGIIRTITSIFKPIKLEDQPKTFAPLKELTFDEFEKVKFNARIAIIDDEEIPHIERLKHDGYNITHFSDIENIDDFLRKKYHVVVLDIQGIGQKISPTTEGWGILKYLKDSCPYIVVIMFTGADWSLTKYKNEADKADDFIGKDLEYLDFKSKLDTGIKKAFSPNYHYEIEKQRILKEIANSQTIEDVKYVIDNFGANKELAIKELRKVTTNQKIIDSMDNLLSIFSSIASLTQ